MSSFLEPPDLTNRAIGFSLRVTAPADGERAARRAEPVSGGVTFPVGLIVDTAGWVLLDEIGTELPFDLQVTDRWRDGSARWAVLDTDVTLAAGQRHTSLRLARRTGRATSSPPRVVLREIETGFDVDTGVASFRLSTQAPFLIEHVAMASGDAWTSDGSSLRICSDGGAPWLVDWRKVRCEFAGTLRTVIAASGEAAGPGTARVALDLRLEFRAGSAVVRSRLTVRNPRRADHPRGIWELGDAGSLLLDEVSLTVAAGGLDVSHLRWTAEQNRRGITSAPVSIHQESSGGDHWDSPNHLDRTGRVPLRYRGYRATVGDERFTGLRATPTVVLEAEGAAVGLAVPQFWQNFPRTIQADLTGITASFLPPESGTTHELQGGEQKTHECYLLFGEDRVSQQPLEWCASRLVLQPDPQDCAGSGAIPYFITAADDDPRYRSLVDAALDGADTFVAKRERADEYGWRHYGDIYGDHEAVRHTGPTPLMSHYNNQYDPVAGFLYQFLRTGDPRWWAHCRDLAAHVIDIDCYHTDEDKSAYNHGLFWHTIHYIDAGKSTHRSYPGNTNGGGPSSEQNYSTGLMLHYFATGDLASRDAALQLAQFVIDIDDGSRTILKYVDRGYTGIASASRTPDYHGPGRGSGNSLNALVDGHRLSGDRRFLDKAEQIIRRCTHPNQDIEALTLLDAENRWFYTMYLQSLAKYLDWKIELGELDGMYAYGRDVLLHFARWMAQHERPYLDHPEMLEFPTETWAAQDVRKSEVFDAAAPHATGEERERFLE
ncbi:MAG TPA: hypothetical protein VL173_17910, partial [Vicinamibacterales bacterium]|nr:hypothetical protein [Vicinamibacterales bacterium]